MIHHHNFVPDPTVVGKVFCCIEGNLVDAEEVFQRLLGGDPGNAIGICRNLCKLSCCHSIKEEKTS